MLFIPPIIHQVWIGSAMPARKKALTETMRGIDGYRYRLWGNEDLTQANFPLMWPYIVQLQDAQRPLSMIGDLMKYELMYHHGGLYFDINIELLRKTLLWDTLKGHALVLCNEDDKRITDYLSCGFFAVVPKHPALKHVLDTVRKLKNLKTGPPNTTTGPYLFYHILKQDPEHHMLPSHMMYPFPPGILSKITGTCTDDCKMVCPDSIAVDHFELGCTWCNTTFYVVILVAVLVGLGGGLLLFYFWA